MTGSAGGASGVREHDDGPPASLLGSPGEAGDEPAARDQAGERADGAALAVLAALAAALLGRGGYFASGQWTIGAFLAVALAVALTVSPPSRADLHGPLLPGLGAVAVWAAIVATLRGSAGNALAPALLVAAVATVLFVCRRLDQPNRDTVVFGVVAVALVVAASGWAGVAFGLDRWRWAAQGVWRASSTLTYPNAAAAVLVVAALLVIGLLTGPARSVPLRLAATGLLVGAGATMSRAGLLALVAGLVVLAAARGLRATAGALAGPVAGAVLALGALAPSSPTSAPARPWLAALGLLAGLAIGAGAARMSPRALAGLAVAVSLAGVLATVFVGAMGDAVDEVAGARFTAESSYRLDGARAAWDVVADHPLTGAGPGLVELRWTSGDGGTGMLRYAHDEYLQVAAELGLVGAAAAAAVLVAAGRLLWRCRPRGQRRPRGDALGARWAGVVAGCAAFAVHGAFDFVWHVPAVPLLVAVLVGLAVPAAEVPVPSGRRSHRQKGAR